MYKSRTYKWTNSFSVHVG